MLAMNLFKSAENVIDLTFLNKQTNFDITISYEVLYMLVNLNMLKR